MGIMMSNFSIFSKVFLGIDSCFVVWLSNLMCFVSGRFFKVGMFLVEK